MQHRCHDLQSFVPVIMKQLGSLFVLGEAATKLQTRTFHQRQPATSVAWDIAAAKSARRAVRDNMNPGIVGAG